jgi:catechol 2,3-dioxygenase-like lactoylglutathione lyase family enzyme
MYSPTSVHLNDRASSHFFPLICPSSKILHIPRKLKEKGIKILYEDRHPFAGGKEHYAVFFEDPDRIKVELVAPRID